MKFRLPLFVIAIAFMALVFGIQQAFADDPAFFKYGPLSLNIPLKTASVVYMFDFKQNRNLVGGETSIVTLWNRIEGTVGAVTSLQGQGTPFVGGNILVGNLVDRWITLPADFKLGGFGGYDFHSDLPIYGLKASVAIW